MKNNDNKGVLRIVFAIAFFVIFLSCYFIYNDFVKQSNLDKQQKLDSVSDIVNLPSFDEMTENRVIGNKNAPVKLLVLSSLSNVHSADFFKIVFPEIVSEFVDKKKIQIVFYDVLFDDKSVPAAMLSRCIGDDETYLNFIKTLYENQSRWYNSPVYKQSLIGYARIAGLTNTSANACINDNALYSFLVKESIEITDKYNITSVPAFVLVKGRKTRVIENYNQLVNAIKKF